MTKKQLQKQIIELKEGELSDLHIMSAMTNRLNDLEKQSNYNVENLRLLMEYLGVHLEDREKLVVEDDCDCCDCCLAQLEELEEDDFEEIKPKKKK